MVKLENSYRLKFARQQAGLSQNDLAKLSGVSLTMIQKYEQGAKNIDNAKLTTLVNLATALNCQIPAILNNPELIKKFTEVC